MQFHQWKLVNLYNFSLKSVPRGALIWKKNICIQNLLHLVLYCSFSSITRKVPFPPVLCYSVDVLIVRLLPGVFGKWHILLNITELLFSQGGMSLPWSKIQYNKLEKLHWFSLLLRSDCISYSIWNICNTHAMSTACISSHLTWYVPRIWHLAHSMCCWYISGMEIMQVDQNSVMKECNHMWIMADQWHVTFIMFYWYLKYWAYYSQFLFYIARLSFKGIIK